MENDFTIDEIINLMKKTKKTDPMFKPLKKLKIALEVALVISRVLGLMQYHLFPQQESSFSILVWEMS
jgi:hypothetical protein